MGLSLGRRTFKLCAFLNHSILVLYPKFSWQLQKYVIFFMSEKWGYYSCGTVLFTLCVFLDHSILVLVPEVFLATPEICHDDPYRLFRVPLLSQPFHDLIHQDQNLPICSRLTTCNQLGELGPYRLINYNARCVVNVFSRFPIIYRQQLRKQGGYSG